MQIFDTILINPMLNLLVALYQLLAYMHIPSALGFAIILITIVIRLLMFPFMHQSLKQQKKMQSLMPKINKIKEKYKTDMQRQQAEMMALYRSEGVNPASGCLFLIIQIPFLIGLYTVLIKAVEVKHVNDINQVLYLGALKLNHIWDTNFFGLPLGQSPAQLLQTFGPAIFLVCVITGVIQLVQSRMMIQKPAEKSVQDKNKKAEPDFAMALQQQMLFIFPVLIGVLSYTYPFGLTLYWNTLTIFGIIQQYIATGWGGLADWLPFLKTKEVSKYA